MATILEFRPRYESRADQLWSEISKIPVDERQKMLAALERAGLAMSVENLHRLWLRKLLEAGTLKTGEVKRFSDYASE